jgi:hypothetical protein
LFSSLERMSRLADIAYCVGTTGLSHPFTCASRCSEFPTLSLITTWSTGVLLSDSCGYIAVDHAKRRPDVDGGGGSGSRATVDALGERAIIVSFRGTYSISNTVIDLSTVPQEYVPYPAPDDEDGDDKNQPPSEPEHRCANCTVHAGFLASWRAARKRVLPELLMLREIHPDYPVHLVGHSLGGAVAALAALELRVIRGWSDILVTTFGEPRVGNQGLADYIDAVFNMGGGSGEGDGDANDDDGELDPEARTFRRVTHVDDPVPLLPPAEMGFRSHGGEFYISKPDLSPSVDDVAICRGDRDPHCIAGGDNNYRNVIGRLLGAGENEDADVVDGNDVPYRAEFGIPSRLKLWQLFFAHRDYFWRLGMCVPGGDPANWGRDKYSLIGDEL